MTLHRIGLALYALLILGGGPVVVTLKRAAPVAVVPARIGLALGALLAIGLLALGARRAEGRARLPAGALAPFGVAAGAAAVRALGVLFPEGWPPSTVAIAEGAEMAAVALGLSMLARTWAPERPVTGSALLVVALGALGMKVVWALDYPVAVGIIALALLPVAVFALVRYWRITRG